MYYLQKVEILLDRKEYEERFRLLSHALAIEGIEVFFCGDGQEAQQAGQEAQQAGQGQAVLRITDSASCAGRAAAKGRAVLAFFHEGSKGQDFGSVKYAFEEPEGLDADYLERVYRRCAGLPWDILDTERCHLRETTEADVDDFYRIYADPSITKYMEGLYPEIEEEKAYIREYIEKIYGFYDFGVWTVIKRDTGEVIGRAGYSYREGFVNPELGFVIGAPWQGQGIAYEVCRGILQYGKEQLGFCEVQALVEPENEVSRHLCSKLGMSLGETVCIQDKSYICFVGML